MATSGASLPSSFMPALARTVGERPLVVKTDGNCLIIKNAITLPNGKRYDVRIWRWDKDGNQIAVDENSTFSRTRISQIPALAKRMFSNYTDPALSRVLYKAPPEEMCQSENLADHKTTDLIESKQTEMVTCARIIHKLLNPDLAIEWAEDPNAQLIIQPTWETPSTPKEREVHFAPEPESIPAKPNITAAPQLTPPSFKDASTSTDNTASTPEGGPRPAASTSEGGPRPVVSTPEGAAKPAPAANTPSRQELEGGLVQSMDKAAAAFRDRNGLTFLNGVTYSDLLKYSRNPDPVKDPKLAPVYDAFVKVVQNPNSLDEDHLRQMRQWIDSLYLAAYRNYQGYEAHFDKFDKSQWSGTFDSWCKYYAANAVAGFIRMPNTNINALVAALKELTIPSTTNISLSN